MNIDLNELKQELRNTSCLLGDRRRSSECQLAAALQIKVDYI